MFASLMRWLTPATLCAWASAWTCAAAAQTPPATDRKPDPLDARVAVPAPQHATALSRYRRTGADRPIPWREANDTAARIGGWRAYAREAQQPDAAPLHAPQGQGGPKRP